LKGISSGLTIAGAGTIKWTILNDDGDEVTIHLHNSLYIPETPMCLLSPQQMAQQMLSDQDGFNSKGKFGTDFCRTRPNNSLQLIKQSTAYFSSLRFYNLQYYNNRHISDFIIKHDNHQFRHSFFTVIFSMKTSQDSLQNGPSTYGQNSTISTRRLSRYSPLFYWKM
jgi:hypothetical protein